MTVVQALKEIRNNEAVKAVKAELSCNSSVLTLYVFLDLNKLFIYRECLVAEYLLCDGQEVSLIVLFNIRQSINKSHKVFMGIVHIIADVIEECNNSG